MHYFEHTLARLLSSLSSFLKRGGDCVGKREGRKRKEKRGEREWWRRNRAAEEKKGKERGAEGHAKTIKLILKLQTANLKAFANNIVC